MTDKTFKAPLKKIHRIFVNRSLNFAHIKFVGFDMDHTLAVYNREEFEGLAFRVTLQKFIEAGYPQELAKVTFKPNFVIRGLLVDRERGNILKVDGHKYVKEAYHGYRRLRKDERHKIYNMQSFKAQEFLSVDTFFSLSEVQLFAEIVDFMAFQPNKITKTFAEVYQDLRHFIDLSHRDGSIKNEVLRYPERYIHKDKNLSKTLIRLLDADKSIFLLTNSNYEYTDHVMSYLLDGEHEDFPSWRDYWDIIIVGGAKPGFFFGSQPFFEVVEDSGLLNPHDGPLHPSRIYHGGNAPLFEKLTGYSGDEILYVGDHIYGDIIQSKDTLNWRTLLIVNEIEKELGKLENLKGFLDEIAVQLEEKEVLDDLINRLRSNISVNEKKLKKLRDGTDIKKEKHLFAENARLGNKLEIKRIELKALDDVVRQLIAEREAQIHPVWGELMKVALERSRFADQVCSYACLYTSKVSNMRFYSPFKKFVSNHESLPHDE